MLCLEYIFPSCKSMTSLVPLRCAFEVFNLQKNHLDWRNCSPDRSLITKSPLFAVALKRIAFFVLCNGVFCPRIALDHDM